MRIRLACCVVALLWWAGSAFAQPDEVESPALQYINPLNVFPSSRESTKHEQLGDAHAAEGRWGAAFEAYREAHSWSQKALGGGEYGTEEVKYDFGGGSPVTLRLPRGYHIPRALALKVADAADRAGLYDDALSWILDAQGVSRSPSGRLAQARDMVAEFESRARREGRVGAAEAYRLALSRDRISTADDELRYARREKERVVTALLAFALGVLAAVLVAARYEWRHRRPRFQYWAPVAHRRGLSRARGRRPARKVRLLVLSVALLTGSIALLHSWWVEPNYYAQWLVVLAWILCVAGLFAFRRFVERPLLGPVEPRSLNDHAPLELLHPSELASWLDNNAPAVLRDLHAADWRGRVRATPETSRWLTAIPSAYLSAAVTGWLGSRLVRAEQPVPEDFDALLRSGMSGPRRPWDEVAGAYLGGVGRDRRREVAAALPAVERVRLMSADGELELSDEEFRDAVRAWLEEAMITGRRWEPSEWAERFVRDPRTSTASRAVVWGAYDEDDCLARSFRVDGEGSIVAIDCETVIIESLAPHRIGVAHATELPPAALVDWCQHLAEFEELDLFDQLGRRNHVAVVERTLQVDLEWTEAQYRELIELGWVERPLGLQRALKPFDITAVAFVTTVSAPPATGVYHRRYRCLSVSFVRGYVPDHEFGLPVSAVEVSQVALAEVLYQLAPRADDE